MRITPEVQAELDKLCKKNGSLTEELVVEESKKKRSPLHSMFLWDKPEEAAHLGRLELARRLIISVKVTEFEAEKLNLSVRMRKYHGTGDGYASVFRVASEDDVRKSVLQEALRQLRGLQEKYRHLQELRPVFEALEKVG